MEFEVHLYAPQPPQHTTVPDINVMDKDAMDIQLMASHKSSIQVHTFRAHRVIVAARCEWFKKALMSGMQESLTRYLMSFSGQHT